jgi:hypothetical protein
MLTTDDPDRHDGRFVKPRMAALLIFALFCFAGTAHATAVSLGTGHCTGTTSCTPSASGVFHIEIAAAVRTTTGTPALPPAQTNINTKVGTTSSMRLTCRASYSTTPAVTGTFTNATNVGEADFVGTNVRSQLGCAIPGLGTGNQGTAASGTTTSTNCPAITLNDTSGNSAVVCAMYNAGGAAAQCTPSGMTAIAGATTGDVFFFYETGVTSFASATCTNGAANNWIAMDVELQVAPSNPPKLSQLVNGDGGMGVYPGETPGLNNVRRRMDPTLAGNMEIITISYSSGVTFTSIIDDQGDTATQAVTCTDSTNSLKNGVYYIQNLTAGATLLTFNFSGTMGSFVESHHQFSGMPTSGSPIDGTPSCITNITSSGSTTGNIADGTGTTPGTNGDLIYSTAINTAFSFQAGASTLQDIVFEPGFTGLYGDTFFGGAAQAEIQATAALIKPSFTYVQASNDQYDLMTVAFKTSSGSGTARPNNKILRMTQSMFSNGVTSSNYVFPCDTGNFINITFEDNVGVGGPTIAAGSISDTAANTWQYQNPGSTNYSQYLNATNATCNGQDFMHITSSTSPTSAARIAMYEVQNALASSAIDTSANTSATFLVAAATTINANCTGPCTSLSLAAAGGITNGSVLMLDSEDFLVTAGGGTTTLTVTGAQRGTASASHTNGASVFISLQTPFPAITTSQANEIIFGGMNQGTGPNWDTANCVFDFGAYPGQGDLISTYANGDGACHQYAATATTYNIGWYLDNYLGGPNGDRGYTNAIAVKLQASAVATPRMTLLGVGP